MEKEAETPGDLVETVFEILKEETEKHSRRHNIEPALRTLSGIPLASLAEIAGSLVSAQNLAQNIRGELATVGGNIDIATITLDEGFRWVSHKSGA
jgi:hypothetical protein